MTKHLLGVILSIGLLYGFIEAWPLVMGPRISIESPFENQSVEGGILEIHGSADRVAHLSVNGTPLQYDQNGGFSSTLTFPRGGSILIFTAADRFGRTVATIRHIFVP